jgi:hypothetical protein
VLEDLGLFEAHVVVVVGVDVLLDAEYLLPPFVEVEEGVGGAAFEFGRPLLLRHILLLLRHLLQVLHLQVLGQVAREQLQVDLVLLGRVVDVEVVADGLERLGRFLAALVVEVVVELDEGGGHVVEGVVELDELHLLLLAVLDLARQLVELLRVLGVAAHQQLVPRLQLAADALEQLAAVNLLAQVDDVLGQLPASVLQLDLQPVDLLLLRQVVPLQQLRLDLLVAVGHRPPDLQQVQVRHVVVPLPPQGFLPEVRGQFRRNQFQVLLALAVALLARQQSPLRFDEVHHEPLEGLVEDISEVFGGHGELGLQRHHLVAQDLRARAGTPFIFSRLSSFSFPRAISSFSR